MLDLYKEKDTVLLDGVLFYPESEINVSVVKLRKVSPAQRMHAGHADGLCGYRRSRYGRVREIPVRHTYLMFLLKTGLTLTPSARIPSTLSLSMASLMVANA